MLSCGTKAKDFLDAKSVLPTRKAELSREFWSQKKKKRKEKTSKYGRGGRIKFLQLAD